MICSQVLFGQAACGRTMLDLSQVADKGIRQVLQGSSNLPYLEALPDSRVKELIGPELQPSELERERLLKLLDSMGFAEAVVDLQSGVGGSREAVLIPRPGPLYRLGWITIKGFEAGAASELQSELRTIAKKYVGQPANSGNTNAMKDDLVWAIKSASMPFPEVTAISIEKDRALQLSGLHVELKAGPTGHFGRVQIIGADLPHDLGDLITELEGRNYDPAVITDIYAGLKASGEFKRFNVDTEAAPGSGAIVNVIITLRKLSLNAALLDKSAFPAIYILLSGLIIIAIRQIIFAGFDKNHSITLKYVNFISVLFLAIGGYLVLNRVFFLLQ